MIQINLLAPGGANGTKKKGLALLPSFGKKKDVGELPVDGASPSARPALALAATAAVLGTVIGIGGGFWYQDRQLTQLDDKLQQELSDSSRFAAVIGERRSIMAKRDSMVHALGIIQQIDDSRYVWPHILDEVGRNLPPYTWLKEVAQVSAKALVPQRDTSAKGDSTAKAAAKAKRLEEARAPLVSFTLTGNTADIQALTRFMRDLEGSPFIQNVTLEKSNVTVVDNREVTEFVLNLHFQKPDPSAITTVPVTLSVR
jgi:Tfp pilus assembly protein PilN